MRAFLLIAVLIMHIPYNENFETQFKAFVEKATQELKCPKVRVVAYPKDGQNPLVITVAVECVQ